MRRVLVSAACAVTTLTALAIPASAAPNPTHDRGEVSEYVVLYKEDVSPRKAHRAVKEAGGKIVHENRDVGLATVVSDNPEFVRDAMDERALDGVAHNRILGQAPTTRKKAPREAQKPEEVVGTKNAPAPPGKPSKDAEPLAGLQWDMKQIHATEDGSYKEEPGDKRVLVGVLDTGVDGDHPDIKANFNRELSRNFTRDIPTDADGNEVDGPCEFSSCVDPADWDDNDHGTHVASTIASPRNGIGMSGVAPNVSIVNLRVGQDSGYFFVGPTVDGLTYAAKNGIDVVNMSFYVDPWLWNCGNNPADSPEDQLEQRTIIKAVQRALDFAHERDVTLVNSAGNERVDYTKTNVDTGSPDFPSRPGEKPYERTIPASCKVMPGEGDHVIPVAATGPSTRKSYYSSFGRGYVAVAAPGGDKVDNPDQRPDDRGGIWAAYPERLAKARGELNDDGTPKVPFIVRSCKGDDCAYYQSLQGTSMASPHAAGVAALIVSKYGHRDRRHGGLSLDPRAVEGILRGTATVKECPSPRTVEYVWYTLRDGTWVKNTSTQTCEGSEGRNGFFGSGIVDALNAVRR
ncbi:subtilase family protein [Actinomadura pelletieri DSM 43383]|uniref:Subtilase family protein n=1 Tax=Actinomadura pelletieri DSM 43383 TaxID=1120940 RepID=A0A495QFK5_9ACTN|nr:S8 family serine peptidase [Actinomadura pelletieri]RKS70707.1 subtilase family protein [Actinomadura pelletieri DSM 43383]